MGERRGRCVAAALVFAAFALVLAVGRRAEAQQKTFYLDRLTVAGGPDDGIAIWRPYAAPRTRIFAQAGLGFSLRPLKVSTVSPDNNTRIRDYSAAPIATQFNTYLTIGTEISGRLALLATMPFTLFQSGTDPTPVGVRGTGDLRPFSLMDARIDIRGLVYQTDDKRWLFGAGMSFWVPSGGKYSYGGDGAASTAFNASVETYVKEVIVVVNTGIHTRPIGVTGELAIGDEWTLGAGGYLPIQDGRYRVGGSVMMSTPTETLKGASGKETSTFLSERNTPIEWMAEGRMALDEPGLWAGAGLGTLLHKGYGAPDLRIIAMIGYHMPLPESDVSGPNQRMKAIRERIAKTGGDADHDGIPDEVDLCPSEPEDHQEPDPNDGCPKPPDKDNDGIGDFFDKCPDTPEDKDGIQDMDGCPEEDYDLDGVPDVSDACPREPGSKSKDPKTNGCPQFIRRVTGSTEIQILEQIQFDTGKATIKPTSFPILDEIVKLLKANTDVKRLSIEGHTDNRGAVEMNNRLSQERANSVMNYLATHGIDADRLEAHGFGPSRPIETNDTDDGRQKNRRVEFHLGGPSVAP